ncbi:PAP2-C domain-containing protein [Aphelenchoides bicaudatus]|nr:PAP2-C domain-containing protein [Aphelenchoides bicaudatus]
MGQQTLPLEIHKVLLSAALLVFAGYFNWIVLAYIHDFVGRQPLPDLFTSFIAEQRWALKLGDVMVTLSSGTMILLFILHKHRAIVMRRTFFILAILYFIRGVSMFGTQLPSGYSDNDRECRPQLEKEERTFVTYLSRVLEQSVHFGLQDTSKKMLCGDMLFSGHTLIMVTSSLVVEYYLPTNLRLVQYVPKLFTVFGIVCLILSRTHYTIDILFATVVSAGVFSIYHAFCEIETYRERKQSVLYRFWIMRLVGWMEANVIPGRVENELVVPFLPKIYRKIRARIEKKKQQQTTSSTSTMVVDIP